MPKIQSECVPGTLNSKNQYWCATINGLKVLHKEDGPAVIFDKEYIEWYGENKKYQWWYMGEQIECSSQEEFERLLKLKAFL